jgi:hypothetical protein
VDKRILTTALSMSLGVVMSVHAVGGGAGSGSYQNVAPRGEAPQNTNVWHHAPWPSHPAAMPSNPWGSAPWGSAWGNPRESATWQESRPEGRSGVPPAPWGAMPPWGAFPPATEAPPRQDSRGMGNNNQAPALGWTHPAPPAMMIPHPGMSAPPFYNAPDSSVWESNTDYSPPGMGYPNWHPQDMPPPSRSAPAESKPSQGWDNAYPGFGTHAPPSYSGGQWPSMGTGFGAHSAPRSNSTSGQHAASRPGTQARPQTSPWPDGNESNTPWPAASGSNHAPAYFDTTEDYHAVLPTETRPNPDNGSRMMGTPMFTTPTRP